jgi:hypothetical protein
MNDLDVSAQWEPQRDRWGRPLIIPPGGGKPVGYTRATTVAKTLDDEGSLIKWAQRMTAAGLVRRPDLLALLASKLDDGGDIPEHHKADVQRLCDEAKEHGGGSRAANLGTALHALTEALDLGQSPYIPLDMQGDIDAYRRAVEPFKVLAVEQFIVLDDHRIGGTFDRLWRLPDGRIVIADLKTGRDLSYSWRSISVQLAIYANGIGYHDGLRTPLHADGVDAATGIVVHLPVGQGRCDLYTVDLRAGTVALQHSMWARNWRNRKDLSAPFAVPANAVPSAAKATPAPAPAQASLANTYAEGAVPGQRTQLRARLQAVIACDGGTAWLRGNWPAGVPTLKQSDHHDSAQLDAIEAVVRQAETQFSIAFGEHDSAPVPEVVPVTPVTRPDWRRPADGRKLSEKANDAVRATVLGLPEEQCAWVADRLNEAIAYGRPVVIERQHTERSRAVIRSLVAASQCLHTHWEGDDDYLRILVAAALQTDVAQFPGTALGATFASLTTDEATRFADVLERAVTGTDIPITFADDGTARLVFDTAA